MSRPAHSRSARREWRLYLFLLPSLAAVGTFAYFPAASAVYHSFFDWQGGDAKQFVGLRNFARMLEDEVLGRSFLVVGLLVLFNLVKMVPSIAMAVVIHRLFSARAQYLYRVLLVVPMVVPGLVTLFVWKFFFDPTLGPLNRFLEATGVHGLLVRLDGWAGWGVFSADAPTGWLTQPELVLPALFLWGFPWIGAVGVLIYLAGLQNISSELYEAAELDGIGPVQKFFYLELPLILTQVRLSLTLLIVSTLQGFGLQLVLLGESGGPGGNGMTPGLWMYNRAFIAGEFGYACAIGVVLTLVILGLTVLNNRLVRSAR